jgi:hypothetical protein
MKEGTRARCMLVLWWWSSQGHPTVSRIDIQGLQDTGYQAEANSSPSGFYSAVNLDSLLMLKHMLAS